MTEFNTWLKATLFKQLETILDETIDQMLLDTFTQFSRSPTSRNFYQEVNQEYASFYIHTISHKLQLATTNLAKNHQFQLDSRKCPQHLKLDIYSPHIPRQINLDLIDIAKQKDLASIYKPFESHNRLIFLDIETDSLQINKANILQISLLEIKCTHNPLNPFVIKPICNSFIKPSDGYTINPFNPTSSIHNITQEQIDNAPSFDALAPEIADQTVLSTLVGFNIHKFDIPILLKHLHASSEKPGWTHTIDLAQAYWKHFPASLGNALKMLDIQHKPLHNAEHDALACIDLLSKLIHIQILPQNPEGFQTLLQNTSENTSRFGNTIIQRNQPTHPWVSEDWRKLYDTTPTDIQMTDIFSSPLSTKRQRSPVILEDRVHKKLKRV